MTRKLSCFFCHELFPLYLEKRLDTARIGQVEEHLKECKDCTALLGRLKEAEKLLIDLSRTEPTPELIAFLKRESHFWNDTFGRFAWSRWPSTLKWAAELCIVAGALVFTIHLFPWLNLARSLQGIKPEAPMAEQMPAVGTDDVAAVAPAEVPAPPPPPAPMIGPQLPPGWVPDSGKAPAVVVAAKEKAPEPPQEESEETVESEKTEAPKTVGFVWRGALKVPEVTDQIADNVTKAIIELGGKKAGKVDLGWRRPNDRYYHFILPDQNYEKLLSQLNSEGLVELIKEKHPRVIKSGYMRIIMTIEAENETGP